MLTVLEPSAPAAVQYNGTTYCYVTNIQGDVIAILNSSGTTVVQYSYDAWGKLLSTTGTMATSLGAVNPLRYRGYIYDQEYELYYLSTRYYNPEIGRFLNADEYPATGQGLLGNNMFVYCLNNPVALQDSSGQSALLATLGVIALGGAIGAVANAVAVASNGGSVKDCALGALAGFIGGAAGTGCAAVMTMCPALAPFADVAGRGVATLVTDLCTSGLINGKVTKEDFAYAAFDATTDMMFSTITYYYNPLTDGLTRTVTNATIDGLTDIGQNELFSQNSFSNRNSLNNSNITTNSSTQKNAGRNYAHMKVGRLIGAI